MHVKAFNLHPADPDGKADPYIVLKLGKTEIKDRVNYIPKQLNPVFGRWTITMIEKFTLKFYQLPVSLRFILSQSTSPAQILWISSHFPQGIPAIYSHLWLWHCRWGWFDWRNTDRFGKPFLQQASSYLRSAFWICHVSIYIVTSNSSLQVSLMLTLGASIDDLMSPSEGYNAWRDCIKPMDLLIKLCKENRLENPLFSPGHITIGNKVFTGKTVFVDEGMSFFWFTSWCWLLINSQRINGFAAASQIRWWSRTSTWL